MLPGGLPWRRRPFPTGPESDTERLVRVTVPDLVLRAQTATTGALSGPIPRDMHISVARSGELCDDRPYLGGRLAHPLPSPCYRAPWEGVGHAVRTSGAPPQTRRRVTGPARPCGPHQRRGRVARRLAPVEGEPDRDG